MSLSNQKRQVTREVAALRALLKSVIVPCDSNEIEWDYYCHYFNMLSKQFGSNVVTAQNFTEAAGLNLHSFKYHLKLYKTANKVAAATLVGGHYETI